MREEKVDPQDDGIRIFWIDAHAALGVLNDAESQRKICYISDNVVDTEFTNLIAQTSYGKVICCGANADVRLVPNCNGFGR
jgi:hypothetical protein